MVVNNCSIFHCFSSSTSTTTVLAGLPSSNAAIAARSKRSCWIESLSPPRTLRTIFCRRFSILSMSANINSVSIVSASAIGSTRSSTCTTSLSSKQRTTWAIASVSRIFAKNWLPNPSPWLAPFTRPAISTNVIRAGMLFAELAIAASLSKRKSGTFTSPIFGSIVQKGKLAAWADAVLVSALNKVDLPTFGRPTMPILKPINYSSII